MGLATGFCRDEMDGTDVRAPAHPRSASEIGYMCSAEYKLQWEFYVLDVLKRHDRPRKGRYFPHARYLAGRTRTLRLEMSI